MQLIDTKCVNCGATLTFPSREMAKCEYCDSVFMLKNVPAGATSKGKKQSQPEQEPVGDPVDILMALTKMGKDLGFGDSCDWFLGASRANSPKAAKRRETLYGITGAPRTMSLWGLLDITIFDNGKKGALIGPNGWYICDEDKHVGMLTWDEFVCCEIKSTSTALYIDKYKFICQDEQEACARLRKIQKDMKRSGYKK